MTDHKVGTREEWLAARRELLEAEKALTRRSDELARLRQDLPWVPVDKTYLFETAEGTVSLADLFDGRSQLLIYHFMFGPEYEAGCKTCSNVADGFDGVVVHLANHDVTLCAVSLAPVPKLEAYRQRMGWSFPWASSRDSDFNYDFNVSFTEDQQRTGTLEYNFNSGNISSRTSEIEPSEQMEAPDGFEEIVAGTGTDWPTYTRQAPGMSAFALQNGVVYHTYSTYARGLDAMWGMYPWLDRAPLGRNETGVWWSRHDEYAGRP